MGSSEESTQGPGTLLRAAREAQGITPRDMADRLNWMPTHLEAIEENRFEVLRGTAFVRGYLRTYARMVSVPEDEVLAALALTSADQDAALERDRNGAEPPFWKQPTFGIGVGVALALLLLVGFWLFQGDTAGEEQPVAAAVPAGEPGTENLASAPAQPGEVSALATPVQESAEQDARSAGVAGPGEVNPAPVTGEVADALEEVDGGASPAPLAAASATAAPDAAALDATAPETAVGEAAGRKGTASAAAAGEGSTPQSATGSVSGGALFFRFSGDCWLEVRNAAGELIYADLRREGDTLSLDGEAPFNILVGDARQVELQYRGEPFEIVTRPGRVIARFTVGEA